GRYDVRRIAGHPPPPERWHERFVQLASDCLREINQHAASPPRRTAPAAGGGSATTLPKDREFRPRADPTSRSWTCRRGADDRPRPRSSRRNPRAAPAREGTDAARRNKAAPEKDR